MGFLDNIKAKITGAPQGGYDDYEDYYDDQEYDSYDEDDRDDFGRSSRSSHASRPVTRDAESVTVVSRKGARGGSYSPSYSSKDGVLEAEENFGNIPRGPVPAARRASGAYDTPSTYASRSASSYGSSSSYSSSSSYGSTSSDSVDPRSYYVDDASSRAASSTTEPTVRKTPGTGGGVTVSATPSIYIFEPETYNQAEQIARRLKNGQPVALSLLKTKVDVAKRVLDFSFGATCALGGSVEKVSEKVFVLLPDERPLADADFQKLRSSGYIRG